MSTKVTFYWFNTIVISAFMAFVGCAYLLHQSKISASFSSLGYPPYFQNILGVAKILGAIVLVVPAFPKLKEWAYAGFTFTFLGAVASHLAMHQGQEAIIPLVALIILAVSYCTRPAERRQAASEPNPFHSGKSNLNIMTTPQVPHLEPLKFSTVPGDRPRTRSPKISHSIPAKA